MFRTLSNSLQFLPLKTGQEVGNKLLSEFKLWAGGGFDFIKGLVNYIIVPVILVALLIYILFVITSIGIAKKQHHEDSIEEKIPRLMFAVIILVLVGGYGVIFGNLLSFFIS